MKIRLSTLNTPLFDHEGLVLNERWGEVDAGELTPAGRAAIVKYRGLVLQVHPHDEAQFKALVDMVAEERQHPSPGTYPNMSNPNPSKKKRD